MKRKQLGMSPVTVLVGGLVAAFLFIVGARAVPAFAEFFALKKVIQAVVDEIDHNSASVAQVRRAFELRSQIDDISSVRPGDLQITKQGGRVVISVEYERKVPVAGNVSLLFDFAASTADSR